jgi:hypothetical protein
MTLFPKIFPLREWILLCIIAFSMSNTTRAQIELVITAGSSHFLGDLGGSFTDGKPTIKDINLQGTRYMIGSGLRVRMGKKFAFRAGAYYARLSADDKYTLNEGRRNRNLNFFSPITAMNAMFEYHFFNKNKLPVFYLMGGIEYFHFDPRTLYNGREIRLQPLGTEGQFFLPGKSPYKLNSFALPFGIGLEFGHKYNGYWTFEISARKTFTDYIDDVSTKYVDKAQLLASNGQIAVDLSDRSLGLIQNFSAPGAIRGKPDHTDNFFFLQISYNWILGGKHFNAQSGGHKEHRLLPAHGACYSF